MLAWPQLAALWDERDNRYRTRSGPGRRFGVAVQLGPDEAAAIRAYRRTEVTLLQPADRRAGAMGLALWYPPTAMR